MNFLPNYVYSGTVRDFLPRLVIGILVGTALHKTATSFVDDILMGPVGYLTGKKSPHELFYDVTDPNNHKTSLAKLEGHATINYGSFLNSTLHLGVSVGLAMPFILYLKRKLKRAEDQLDDAVARGLIEPKLIKVRQGDQAGSQPAGAPLQIVIPAMSWPISAPVSADAMSMEKKPLPLSALDDGIAAEDPLIEKKKRSGPVEPVIAPYQPTTKLTPQFLYPEPVIEKADDSEKVKLKG